MGFVSRSRCCSASDSFRVFRPPGTQPHAYCVVHGCEPPTFPHFLRREPSSLQLLQRHVAGRLKRKSIHFVVQRQLTDVSDCTKNNLPQLLTSIHKSQLMHGTSPRDFVTLLQTCKAIYKVVANVMEGIFFQVENVTTDAQEALFPPQAHGSRVGPTQKRFHAIVVPRSGKPHDTSFYSVYLDGFSYAELKHWNQLSHPEKWS